MENGRKTMKQALWGLRLTVGMQKPLHMQRLLFTTPGFGPGGDFS